MSNGARSQILESPVRQHATCQRQPFLPSLVTLREFRLRGIRISISPVCFDLVRERLCNREAPFGV